MWYLPWENRGGNGPWNVLSQVLPSTFGSREAECAGWGPVDGQSHMWRKPPAFFADNCLLQAALIFMKQMSCEHKLGHSSAKEGRLLSSLLSGTILKRTSIPPVPIATYLVWILSVKGKYKWSTTCLLFPMVAPDETEIQPCRETSIKKVGGRYQCQVRKRDFLECKSASLFPPTNRLDSDYSWKWSTNGWDPPFHNIY